MKERHAWWARVLVLGLVLFAINVLGFAYTHNNVLLAPILILGSFLVPVTCVIATLEWLRRGQAGALGLELGRVLGAFCMAGLVAVVFAALIETQAVEHGPQGWYFLLVAITEEGLKLAVLWLVARGLGTFNRRQGMVLGAVVGFGFAAFETVGQALNVLLQGRSATIDMVPLLETLLLRGVLAPFGHGLWTALLGGALFAAAAKTGKLHITWSVVGWFAVAVLLHTAWDAAASFAVILTDEVVGIAPNWKTFTEAQIPHETVGQQRWLIMFITILRVIVAVVGLLIFRHMWRTDDSPAEAEAEAEAAPQAAA